jgi:hypothetical protein
MRKRYESEKGIDETEQIVTRAIKVSHLPGLTATLRKKPEGAGIYSE